MLNVAVISIGNGIRVQNLDEAVCLFLHDDVLGKTFIWQPVKEKENSEFKPGLLCSKIDFVSCPASGGVIRKINAWK